MRVTKKFGLGVIGVVTVAAALLAIALSRSSGQQAAQTDVENASTAAAAVNKELTPEPGLHVNVGNSDGASAPGSHVEVSVNGAVVPIKELGSTRTTMSDDGTETKVDVNNSQQNTTPATEESGSGRTRTTTRVNINTRTVLDNKKTNPAGNGPVNLNLNVSSGQSTP